MNNTLKQSFLNQKLFQNLLFLALLLFVNLNTVFAGCTCDPKAENRDKAKALKFKLIALATILFAGGLGVALPFLGKIIPALSPEKDIFFLIKAFAAGVILATGFIHTLPDAFDKLTSPCLSASPCGEFPFTGMICMVATLGTLLFECHATAYQHNSRIKKCGVVNGDDEENHQGNQATHEHEHGLSHMHAHTHASHGHAHGSIMPLEADRDDLTSLSEVNRYRIVSKVLELGIIVHSVIIGLSLGASETPSTIKPLVAALTFHQFFEGMGLGGCISQAKFKSLWVTLMGAFFTLTTPMGIVLGILVTNTYKENSSTALIVEGTLNAASAGILIYMALVDLLSADFMNPRIQGNLNLHLTANASLLIGAGCMTLLAKWA